MYNLFLDDYRMPEDVVNYINNDIYINKHWKIVRNYEQFVDYIERNGLPNIISFDHDLSDVHYSVQSGLDENYYDNCNEKTGYHCAQWLIEYCMDNDKKLPKIILIHSMNVIGSENIRSLFESYIKVHDK
jgi:uncharacterized protein YpiB (UPF0302 family)